MKVLLINAKQKAVTTFSQSSITGLVMHENTLLPHLGKKISLRKAW